MDNPKIAEFIARSGHRTPYLVVDVERVENNYRRLAQAMPGVSIHYAVKANPAPPVLDRLASLGSSFDAASLQEIRMCLRAGADPSRILFGNTVKKSDAVATACELGIRTFAVDSTDEVRKVAENAPGSRIYCRLLVENDGAEWPLSRKFGARADMAFTVMCLAAELGLDAHGLSFHVGSQQTGTAAHVHAIGLAADVHARLTRVGMEPRFLDMGGGFPVRYSSEVPGIETFARDIRRALVDAFGARPPALAIEPGRFLVADAGVLSSEVVLVSRKSEHDELRWVYLDIGRFGGLAETEGEAIRYRFETARDGAATGPVAIAGPTCDGADILYEHSGYRLPLSLRTGDLVRLMTAGAYTTTYASQGFNGFEPLDEHYI